MTRGTRAAEVRKPPDLVALKRALARRVAERAAREFAAPRACGIVIDNRFQPIQTAGASRHRLRRGVNAIESAQGPAGSKEDQLNLRSVIAERQIRMSVPHGDDERFASR